MTVGGSDTRTQVRGQTEATSRIRGPDGADGPGSMLSHKETYLVGLRCVVAVVVFIFDKDVLKCLV